MPQQAEKESQHVGMSRAQMRAVLDKFGPYQRRLLMLLFFPVMAGGYNTMAVVLTLFSPDHRCQVPGLANDTFAIQNDAHRMMVNLSIPMTSTDGDVSYSKCDVYKDRDEQHANRTLYDVTEPCNSWVYDNTDFENTAITQFDLVCEDRGFRANFNMINMMGTLVGSAVSGVLCDRFGRKKVFMVAVTLNVAVIIAMAFPVVAPMLLVYNFLIGAVGITYYLALYVLSLEFMGPSRRTWAGSLMMVLYVFGPLMVGGLSYVIRDWRWLQILNVVPFAVCFSYWWLIDESPRWLMAKGHVQEAQKVMLKVMKVNKTTLPANGLLGEEIIAMEDIQQDKMLATENTYNQETIPTEDSDITGDTDEQKNAETDVERKHQMDEQQTENVDEQNKVMTEEEQEIPQESPLKLLKFPNLIARTCIIFFNWSAVSTTYYGLSLNVANLGGSVRLNFLFSNLVQMVGCSAAWILLDRRGRKRTHCAVMLLSGAACLATIFSVMFGGSELHWVTVLLVMVGKLGISAAFSTVYLMTGELFPTVIRNMGMGSSSTVARVATALAPYIADLSLHIEGNLGRALPLVIFGALALTAGLLALCLPETLHRKLPDTILEAANFTKRQSDDRVHEGQVTADSRLSP